MAMRGMKRHLVTLQNPGVDVPDGRGGVTNVPEYLTPPTMYAAIRPATARDLERSVANTVQSTASHIVELDYHPQVTTATRVLFGSRVLQVVGVQNPDERNVDMVLACEEVVA
jgi:head-tail adaptor